MPGMGAGGGTWVAGGCVGWSGRGGVARVWMPGWRRAGEEGGAGVWMPVGRHGLAARAGWSSGKVVQRRMKWEGGAARLAVSIWLA